MEQITCQDCGETWEREPKRGRKPKRCPDCHGTNERRLRPAGDPCPVDGCGAPSISRGMCRRHYTAWWKKQNPAKVATYKARKRQNADRYNASRRKPSLPPRNCLVCDREFSPHAKNQVTCRPSDSERAQGKKQSWCSAKHSRYKKGECRTLKGTPPEEGGYEFDCANCGRATVAGENGTHISARRFCDSICKSEWHRKHGKHRTKHRVMFCEDCGEPCLRKKRRCSLCDSIHRDKPWRWVAGPCPECGQSFIGRWHPKWPASYCCDAHAERAAKREARKRNGRYDTHRKRARRYGCEYEPISRLKVFERDNYTCQICGEATSSTYSFDDPWSPTIDHIVPMSKRGGHVWDNVQCAHAFCNSVKNDGRSGDDAAEMLGADLAAQVA